MPKLYEYLGILIFFYSNEHESIHVHAKHGRNESKAEIIIENGTIAEIRISSIAGSRPLASKELKYFKEFLEAYANEIIKN